MTALITEDAAAFHAALPPMTGLLGLDLGTKTIGVALSDGLRTIATPQTTLKKRKFGQDAEAIAALLSQRSLGGIVLGLPRNMEGDEGPRAQSTRAFARNFANLHPCPILLWDERLSTVAAERALLEADTSRKKRSEVIDSVAAGFILQGVLDRLTHLQNSL